MGQLQGLQVLLQAMCISCRGWQCATGAGKYWAMTRDRACAASCCLTAAGSEDCLPLLLARVIDRCPACTFGPPCCPTLAPACPLCAEGPASAAPAPAPLPLSRCDTASLPLPLAAAPLPPLQRCPPAAPPLLLTAAAGGAVQKPFLRAAASSLAPSPGGASAAPRSPSSSESLPNIAAMVAAPCPGAASYCVAELARGASFTMHMPRRCHAT